MLSIGINAQPDHTLWSQVLADHVTTDGRVDYKAIANKPEGLISYLNALVTQQPEASWSLEDQMAYWINAYNAYTIKLIIDHYPIKSIRDIEQPWDQNFIPYNQGLISLNHIEHKILRKQNEPRIHFAIVCASISCPKLANTAFTAEELETQLEEVTRTFLNDPSKNRFEEDTAELSKIFKWFSKDFKDRGGAIEFIKTYKDISVANKSQLSYLEYNWDLNE